MPSTNLLIIVVESYIQEPNRQVIISRYTDQPVHLYMYANLSPAVEFGDVLLFNLITGVVFLHRGNSRLTFRVFTHTIPENLLTNLILNQPPAVPREELK